MKKIEKAGFIIWDLSILNISDYHCLHQSHIQSKSS